MVKADVYHHFADTIWQWYANHKRDLPWRDLVITDDTQRAYRVLVSEIMLQQTQVNRVKIVYKNFLELFPKLEDLAAATNGQVIMAWRGMGYNSRALRLRDCAKEVQSGKWKTENALFPKDMTTLQKLPGVGHYTAAAVRNFAFNKPTPCLDTNIRRIIHRAFHGPEQIDGTWRVGDKRLLLDAEHLLDAALDPSLSTIHSPLSTRCTAANWHAALMDYGSLVCTKRSPKWDMCPLTKAGLMKAAYKVHITKKPKKKQEPGRMVGAKYIPNRIFRGKVVEELRDEEGGLSVSEIGQRICIDWQEAEHLEWLRKIIEALKKDHLVTQGKAGRVKLVA